MGKVSNEEFALAANVIRGLAIDSVQAANSGHPGMPMGMADVAAVLWLKHLKHCPSQSKWADRDRFVLSGGHGSTLLYSLLHLAGYDLPLEELAQFRQLNSLTPGHPEYMHTDGVETTTGPLGQGLANAVGMAMAEQMLAERVNADDYTPVDHYSYAICGDGDMMEGISHEACSLAGHLGLNKLVLFYDSNRITIEGSTDLAYSDDVKKRFQSYNWNVIEIDAHDFDQIDKAIRKVKREKNRPSLIVCNSHIGQGSPNLHDTADVHGAPLGADEVAATKSNIGLPADKSFYVPEEVYTLFATQHKSLKRKANKWAKELKAYSAANTEWRAKWDLFANNEIPADIESYLPVFEKATATRAASGTVIQALAKAVPQLVGGAADLAPSTKTFINGEGSVGPNSFGGRNLHFGIRELAMGAILNGMAVHGGFRVYGATFFVFSDYVRPTLRLAALMNLPVIYVFTHDSFYVGEDGPTHEPVEQIPSLRCMPNVTVIRPADPTETGAAWVAALKNNTGPTLLLLTRQDLDVLDRNVYPAASELEKGAYTLWQSGEGEPDMVVMATGSEVNLSLNAAKEVASDMNIRVVSMPCLEMFDAQSKEYRDSVLPPNCKKRLAVEAATPYGWEKYIGAEGKVIGMDGYGKSGPYKVLEKEFGFTVENVVSVIRGM
ncbi:MAG: transketolase [Kiritimatiellae bacterium]|nr:transketolase [Kiritimatiellia bacterium]